MIKQQEIIVRSSLDVVTARVQVREMARRLGFSLTDQARISMATSSLANYLGLGKNGSSEGRISMECLEEGTRRGLKVICKRNDVDSSNYPTSYFHNESWLVDEVDLSHITPDSVEVAMIKWAEI